MSVTEIIGLGIKGQNIVLSTLKKVEDAKKKAAEFNAIDLSGFSKKEASLVQKLSSIKGPTLAQELQAEVSKNEKDRTEERNRKISEHMEPALTAAQGLSTLQTGAAIKGLVAGSMSAINLASGGTLSPFATAFSQGVGMFVDAAQSFVSQVKSAAQMNADTADAQNRANNLLGGQGGNFARGQWLQDRIDLGTGTQRAIIEGLGAKYGIVQNHLLSSVKDLFGKGQNAVDVKQAQQLAMGNFAALGTDEGWFLEKVSSQFAALPPSMRQELTAGLIDGLDKSQLMKQGDIGERTVVTSFETTDRDTAASMAKQATKAIEIQRLVNETNARMVDGMGVIIDKLKTLPDDIEAVRKKFQEIKGGLSALSLLPGRP